MSQYILASLIAALLITFLASITVLKKVFARTQQTFLSKSEKENCTGETEGRITRYQPGRLDTAGMVWVSYVVGAKEYIIGEPIHLESRAIKAGRIPIGQEKTPKLGNITVGMKVTVRYDPDDPEKAFIPQNEGHVTN